jgi:endogenous inhibitor of DNA gyrase (YacG/DUF329 family)
MINKYMNISKCPHCGSKLGNYLYATECPQCHKELEHNNMSKFTVAPQKRSMPPSTVFPLPLFRWLVRVVET